MKLLLNIILLCLLLGVCTIGIYIYMYNTKTVDNLPGKEYFADSDNMMNAKSVHTEIPHNKKSETSGNFDTEKKIASVKESDNSSDKIGKKFCEINIIHKDSIIKINAPVLPGAYIMLPVEYMDNESGMIITYNSKKINFNVCGNNYILGIIFIKLDIKDTDFNYLYDTEFEIGDELNVYGYRNQSISFDRVYISKKIVDDFDYRFLGNYILSESFDKHRQFTVVKKNRVTGIVMNNIFFKYSYIMQLLESYKNGNDYFPVMAEGFNSETLEMKIGGSQIAINSVNGYNINSAVQLRNLLNEFYIVKSSVKINNGTDISSGIIYQNVFRKIMDFDADFENVFSGRIIITYVPENSVLKRFNIKPGTVITGINGEKISHKFRIADLFYYKNQSVNEIELFTDNKYRITIKW